MYSLASPQGRQGVMQRGRCGGCRAMPFAGFDQGRVSSPEESGHFQGARKARKYAFSSRTSRKNAARLRPGF